MHRPKDLFPEDPVIARRRIRSYERSLAEDMREHRTWLDGFGQRFLLGSLYMLNGDVPGALDFYRRKEEAVPTDSPEPYDHLTWALALHREGHERAAFTKLYRCDLSNLYLVPFVIGAPLERPLEIWHGTNWETLEYATGIPPALLRLWNRSDREWARSVHEHAEVVELRRRYIELRAALAKLPVGTTRSAVVAEGAQIARHVF
jgi:hypothetical protein